MTYMYSEFIISVLIGVLIFTLGKGYHDLTVKRISKYIFNTKNIKYLLILLLILIVIWYYFKVNFKIIYCIDEHVEKKLTEVYNNNVTINNPNTNVPDSPIKNTTNVGAGTAIAGGMTAAAKTLKYIPYPPLIKLGIIVGGGIAGASILTGYNLANKIFNRNTNNTKTNDINNDPYSSHSVLENSENYNISIDNVILFLNSNLILHVAISYLTLVLLILFVCDIIAKSNMKLSFIKNIFGIKIHKLVLKAINYVGNLNKIWIFITIIILIICNATTVYFADLILLNIDTISNIIVSK